MGGVEARVGDFAFGFGGGPDGLSSGSTGLGGITGVTGCTSFFDSSVFSCMRDLLGLNYLGFTSALAFISAFSLKSSFFTTFSDLLAFSTGSTFLSLGGSHFETFGATFTSGLLDLGSDDARFERSSYLVWEVERLFLIDWPGAFL